MKRPNNFDDLLNVAKYHPDVHGALSQVGISLKHVGYSMGGERWQTETRSGTQGDFSAIAFIHKPDGSWVFYDNKARFGRNAIDPITFLREGFGITFDDAVYMLSGGAPSAPIAKPQKLDTLKREITPQEKPTYTPPTPAPDKLRNVKAYLIQTRKLPKELVLPLIDSGRIYSTYYENPETHKQTLVCAFKITDENGNDVGCDSCSPQPEFKFKHLFTGSNADYAWCFPYEVEEITSETPIFFCEAPIDTMSLCTLSGTPGVYVSMAGLKDSTFNSITEKLGGTPIICVDNDEAGEIFAKRHSDVQRMKAPYGKDWNDTLKYYVENNLSYAFSPPDAAARADVPLEDKDGGHVVHQETEENKPKKENDALDKGASGETEYLKAVSELETISDEAYLKARSEDPFILVSEHTPNVILNTFENGKDRQILIRRDALYLALRKSGIQQGHYHGLGKDTLLNLPKYLEDPDVILSTETNNETRRLLLTSIPSKNGQGIISIEFETLKIINDKRGKYNLIVTFFDLHKNYLNTLFKKHNAKILKQKEDVAQSNPQLYEWLRIINAPSSINSIPENSEKVNTLDEKNSKPLNDEDPIYAAARADVPLEDKDGGHVVHQETEEHEPKKENGALDKGASGEKYFINLSTDNELSKRLQGTYGSKKYKAIQQYIIDALGKDPIIINNGLSVIIDNRDAQHIAHNAVGEKIAQIYHIKDLLTSAILFAEDKNVKHNKFDYFSYHEVYVKYKEDIYPVYFNIGKGISDQKHHVYDITKKIGDTANRINGLERPKPDEGYAQKNDISTYSITSIKEKINTSDEKNSKPLNDEDPIGADSNEKLSQDELRAALEGKVKNVVENYRADPRALADYVLFTSRFNNYSANNLRLIWAQYPTAQFVTSAYDFSHGLPDKDGKPTVSEKIFINKGERALRIWKPYGVKYTVLPDGTEKRSAWLTKSERELAKAENWKTITRQYFTLVPVFDITQTTASPDVYPKLLGLGGTRGTSADKSFEAMKNYAENVLNCPVTVCDFEERKASVRGSFYPDLNEIRISDMLEGENKLSTLIHEIGHASLHADSYANVSKSTAQIELEADMYALMIERRLGIEPTDARCRHLKAHYDMYLAETKATDINADTTLFNNVIDRFREQVPLIDAYVENLNVVEAQIADIKTTQDIKQQEQRVNTTKL